MQPSSIITLLTDFGHRDAYTACMKGVILGINPHANIVDISHQVGAQNIEEGAFLLKVSHGFFPTGTVHVCVVDPGVGTDRRILAVRTESGFFIAPDNGLLKHVLAASPACQVIHLQNRKYFRPEISETFHGRDVFAPVAAHLSLGVPIEELGPETMAAGDATVSEPRVRAGRVVGKIIYVDHFGNGISNIDYGMIQQAFQDDHFDISVFDFVIPEVQSTYATARTGQPIALVGSSGLLEIAVKNGSAEDLLGLTTGTEIVLTTKR